MGGIMSLRHWRIYLFTDEVYVSTCSPFWSSSWWPEAKVNNAPLGALPGSIYSLYTLFLFSFTLLVLAFWVLISVLELVGNT
jgi:hypothetical protein